MRFKTFYDQFELFGEEFETMDKLLRNPKYSDNFRHEVIDTFTKAGGKILGAGKFGEVLSFPTWNYVLKTFKDDRCYVRFVRLVMRNQDNPAFPKFFDKPRKIRPFYKRTQDEEFLYIVRMEKLFPTKMEKHEFYKLEGMLNASRLHYLVLNSQEKLQWYDSLSETHKQGYINNAREFFKNHSQYRDLFSAYNMVHDLADDGESCGIDMHTNNIMMRENGELVLIDPLWFDDNPFNAYAAHDHAMRMERDYYGGMRDREEDDEKPDPYLRGGERHRRVKVKKPKSIVTPEPIVNSYDDNIPF